MKWNELQDKAQVKLTCDLRILIAQRANELLTPEMINEIAPVAHKQGDVFTVYQVDVPEGWPVQTELYNECTDATLLMPSGDEMPAHFTVLELPAENFRDPQWRAIQKQSK